MKTVKCLYGFSHGASAKYSCMYCWQKKGKKRQLNAAESREPWKYKQPWNGNFFTRSILAKPTRGLDGEGKWAPIVDVPMIHVHFYTFHTMYQVIEKIVHMQISYVWLIKDSIERKEAIAAMEHALSKANLYSGVVVLTHDAKLSGQSSDLPAKISFNGAKCRKMFETSTMSNFDAARKDICEAERNNSDQGRSKQQRQEVWKAFIEQLPYIQYMTKPSKKQRTTSGFYLSPERQQAYKGIVERWGKAYVAAFGEGHVTHYVVSLHY